MIARQLMDSSFSPLHSNDEVHLARRLMHEQKISEYPVFDNGQFMGFLHLKDLEDKDPQDHLKAIKIHDPVWVEKEESIRTIWTRFLDHHSTCLAVGSPGDSLSGIIRRPDVLKYTQMWLGFGNDHHLLILKIRKHEYTLANMIGISQDTECRLMGLITIESEDEDHLFLITDLMCQNLQAIVAAFIRYGIEIEHIMQEGEDEDLLTDRLDMLMSYLNV